MKHMIEYYKKLYDFFTWNVTKSEEVSLVKTFSPCLFMESTYEKVSREVSPPMWGESLYTHYETMKKRENLFSVKIWPYYTVEKAKEGMLLRMISSVPFEKAEDIKIGDLCYTHPCFPSSYLLLLNGRTMIEISVPERGEHMDDIKELASLIVQQMNDVEAQLLNKEYSYDK